MTASRAFGAAVLLFLVSGCATARPIAPLDTSSAGYRDRDLSDADLASAGIAVLPVTSSAPGDAFTAERVGPRVAMAIEGRQVCAVVLDPVDVKQRFAGAGVTGRFEKMLRELPQTGELEPETLGAMAEATGCRYFLQAYYRSGSSYDVAPVEGRPHASRAITSTLHAQLWDAVTGEVVWEGAGGGAALTNPPNGGTSGQTVSLAVSGLAAVLAKDPSALPPPHEVAELHHLEHMEAASVEGENAARADAALTGLEIMVDVLQIASAIAEIAD